MAIKQVLIPAHVKFLLKIKKIVNKDDIKGIHDLFNHVESCVRDSKSLKLESEDFGCILITILFEKLSDELNIIISRKFGSATWTLDRVLEYLHEELRAQENCVSNLSSHCGSSGKSGKGPYTTSGFHIQGGKVFSCVYCNEDSHGSAKCKHITNAISRKNILRKNGRCFLCLQKGHSVGKCPSKYVCVKCKKGGHHISICLQNDESETMTAFSSENRTQELPVMSANDTSSVLMQTAKANILDVDSNNVCLSRILFDTGSQRSYVSINVRNKLNLKTIRQEKLIIKTFGDDASNKVRTLDVVAIKVKHKDTNKYTLVEALCVPKICSPLKGQYIKEGSKSPELQGLSLADRNDDGQVLPIGVLIGIDYYFKFFTGKTIHCENGIIAVQSLLGYVLSGHVKLPSSEKKCMDSLNMRCFIESPHDDVDVLRQDLKNFWEIEEVKPSDSVVDKFKNDIYHDGERYVSKLPFKADHDCLPDNYNVCERRLRSVKERLVKLDILKDYDQVFKQYEENKIIERVPKEQLGKELGQVHYLPHRPVVREDKETTKIRAVFDASCKVNGPSLNECLYAGPNLLLRIFDILLRFRCNRIGLIADINQAFLNVGIADEHKDFLRFLWYDLEDDSLIVFRFLRVVICLTSSPFLLNATIRHHLEKFSGSQEAKLCETMIRDLYMDDLVTGCDLTEEGKDLYCNSKRLMSGAGFLLRKRVTNDVHLSEFISNNENENLYCVCY